MNKLSEIIKSMDGKPVTAYKNLCGIYEIDGVYYDISSIYGNQVKYAKITITFNYLKALDGLIFKENDIVAAENFIMREFFVSLHLANLEMNQSESNIQKGFFVPYKFGNRVLPNSSVNISGDKIKITFLIKLPYNTSAFAEKSFLALTNLEKQSVTKNRKKGIISSKSLKILLLKNLPNLTKNFLKNFNFLELKKSIELYTNQKFIRQFLKQNGFVSFIANGSILTRKGKTDYKEVFCSIPFKSPKSMEISINLPNNQVISGMGIREGITIITGDAYHGKSTIIDAIKEGIYDHIINDGREYVITEESAIDIFAEDGRNIKKTDISFFLNKLPLKNSSPAEFSTDNASGSTSQAAAISEAIESKCKLLLFDEDRSANNFMYKDMLIKKIVRNASTVPYIDNARLLFEKYKISSIIVVGAIGELIKIADTVILVDNFIVSEYKDYIKEDCNELHGFTLKSRQVVLDSIRKICLFKDIEIKNDSNIRIGRELIYVPDIVSHITRGQLDFICSFIYYLTVIEYKQPCQLYELVKDLYAKIKENGLESIHQTSICGSSYIIEFVRLEDIMSILFRLKLIDFKGEMK